MRSRRRPWRRPRVDRWTVGSSSTSLRVSVFGFARAVCSRAPREIGPRVHTTYPLSADSTCAVILLAPSTTYVLKQFIRVPAGRRVAVIGKQVNQTPPPFVLALVPYPFSTVPHRPAAGYANDRRRQGVPVLYCRAGGRCGPALHPNLPRKARARAGAVQPVLRGNPGRGRLRPARRAGRGNGLPLHSEPAADHRVLGCA
jgi:hypothetical protein